MENILIDLINQYIFTFQSEQQMKTKLTFAQRLVKQSTSKERQSADKTSLSKTAKSHSFQKTQYIQFKQQHNELKNMLQLFSPTKAEEFDDTSQLVSTTPIRNRLNQKKACRKNNNFELKPTVIQAVKQKTWEIKVPKITGGSFSTKKQSLPRTQTTITPSPRNKQTSTPLSKKGIPNIGNTCYINSLVQCLFHLPHFNDYFSDQKYKGQRNGKNKDVVQMYRELYINVMRNSSQVDLSTLPLKRSVSKICSLFIDWEQEDAHQFMKELINSIHQELNKVINKPKYKQMHKEIEGQTLQKMASAFWTYQKSRDDSYIYDSLCGQTYNNIKCISCGHQSQCFENFLDLSIPMALNQKSLQDLLQSYFEPQKLSDYYSCGQCKKSSKKSTKTVQLWRAPKFLIIHLKRSQFSKKNTDAIRIAQSLTLKPFMTLSNDKSAKFCQYSLCGIIMHQGVVDGGHYWCNVKENGKWFEIDDDNVKQLNSQAFKKNISTIGSSNAYILFYSSLY